MPSFAENFAPPYRWVPRHGKCTLTVVDILGTSCVNYKLNHIFLQTKIETPGCAIRTWSSIRNWLAPLDWVLSRPPKQSTLSFTPRRGRWNPNDRTAGNERLGECQTWCRGWLWSPIANIWRSDQDRRIPKVSGFSRGFEIWLGSVPCAGKTGVWNEYSARLWLRFILNNCAEMTLRWNGREMVDAVSIMRRRIALFQSHLQ